ncbi:hypothetical protein BOX15_Mlig012867g1 [Macrostomum lignano]|uniref:Uncharacterized protein n=1 Tax=Macrostomum lignano TaxID=282301 RepID=A0A267GT84_9PLAT|nr:hypothetical protein BOX15_Mlig028232g1 [Macrostomum lignano]PAA75483.1 hypothetical protein BOX15_Mlig028232g2 [Macrostomum lignano]PAA89236.1 hypothetical protein BOX15_Mlig012867g1 [Macrostomum lignano]
MFGQVARRAFSTSVVRQSESFGFGSSLPFNVKNKTRLSINMLLYTMTGFGAPLFAGWWQLKKKRL